MYSKESTNLLEKITNEKSKIKKQEKELKHLKKEENQFDLLFKEAVHSFESSAKIKKDHKLYDNWAHLHFSRAHCYDILEDQEEAISCYLESIKYFEISFSLNINYEKSVYNWGKAIDRITSYKLGPHHQKDISIIVSNFLKLFVSFSKKRKSNYFWNFYKQFYSFIIFILKNNFIFIFLF